MRLWLFLFLLLCGVVARGHEWTQSGESGDFSAFTAYAYDNGGNLRVVTDPRGNTTDARYGKNLRLENRWSDTIYHDAILQAALRSAVAPKLEVQAAFSNTLGGRRYASNANGVSIPALLNLRLADGGLRQWATEHREGGGDVFLSAQVGSTTEWGTREMLEDFADSWGRDRYGNELLSFESLASSGTVIGGIVGGAYDRWASMEAAGITNPLQQWALLSGEYSGLLSPISGAYTLRTGRSFYDGSETSRWSGALELGLSALPIVGKGAQLSWGTTRSLGQWAGRGAGNAVQWSRKATVASRAAMAEVRGLAARVPFGPSSDGRLRLASPRAGALLPEARAASAAESGLARTAVTETQLEFAFARGASVQTPGVTVAGETFVRVGVRPVNLKFGATPGGVQPGTYAFPEATFNAIGENPALLKNLGDLPGAAPQYFRVLRPPAGTPIQRGIVPGGEFGGTGGVGEVIFPSGF